MTVWQQIALSAIGLLLTGAIAHAALAMKRMEDNTRSVRELLESDTHATRELLENNARSLRELLEARQELVSARLERHEEEIHALRETKHRIPNMETTLNLTVRMVEDHEERLRVIERPSN